MMKALLATIALCVLSSNVVWAEDKSEPQDGHARVRFFGQAAIGMTFYKNQTCYGGHGVEASRTGLGGLFGSKKNISLGIPETPNVTNLKARDGILAAAFYREYSLNSGEPLTILASYKETTGRTGYSCTYSPSVFFTPENGQDYEVVLDVNDQCRLSVKRIELKEAVIQLMPVELAEAKKCPG